MATDYKRISEIYDVGYDKLLRRGERMETQSSEKKPDYGFGGDRFGEFIRVEGGSIIIKDNFGLDRVIIGDLSNV